MKGEQNPMMNPITEMRRLSDKSFEELLRFAVAVCGFIPDTKCSKIELITYIVAQEYMHDHIAERIAHPEMNTERTRYRFCEMDDTVHYILLTPEQERFMKWNRDNAINYDNIEIDVVDDIEWEAP